MSILLASGPGTTRLPPDWTVRKLIPFRHKFLLKKNVTEKYTKKQEVHSLSVALRSRPRGRDGRPRQAGGVSWGTRRVVGWLCCRRQILLGVQSLMFHACHNSIFNIFSNDQYSWFK